MNDTTTKIDKKAAEISQGIRTAVFNRTGLMPSKDTGFDASNIEKGKDQTIALFKGEPISTKEFGILSSALQDAELNVVATLYSDGHSPTGMEIRIRYVIHYQKKTGGSNGMEFDEHFQFNKVLYHLKQIQ